MAVWARLLLVVTLAGSAFGSSMKGAHAPAKSIDQRAASLAQAPEIEQTSQTAVQQEAAGTATGPDGAPTETTTSFLSKMKKEAKKDLEVVKEKLQKVEGKVKAHFHKDAPKDDGKALNKADKASIDKLVGYVSEIQKEFDAHNVTEKLLASRLEEAMLQTRMGEAEVKASASDAAGLASPDRCPPEGFDTQKPFDFEDFFLGAPWYVQEQYPTPYTPPISLYCVAARYALVNESNPGEGVRVLNYANLFSVNGFPIGVSGTGGPIGGLANNIFYLKATISNPADLSRVIVGPQFTGPIATLTLPLLGLNTYPQIFQGGLWVVRAGPGVAGTPDFKGYEWAILTGGLPAVQSGDGCRSGLPLPTVLQINNVGYWLFTRAKVAPPELIAEMKALGASLGLDNSRLRKVEQEGCDYKYFLD